MPQGEAPKSGGNTLVKPYSRKILTLEERVRAIEAYDLNPVYSQVARMFNCGHDQIKNIIENRKAIMNSYQAAISLKQSSNLSPDEEINRRCMVAFLGECVYEYIQRAQFHSNAQLSEEIIRAKATEFRELMQIKGFVANKAWLNQLKIDYNISFSQRQILLTRTPPALLDLKSIMTYCSQNGWETNRKLPTNQQTNKPLDKLKTAMDLVAGNSTTRITAELEARRQHKINFLEKAFYEYIQRAQFYHKMQLSEELQLKIACELKDMLEIDNFVPTKSWIKDFKRHYKSSTSQHTLISTRTPIFSLDLKDIISYCSRMDQKNANASPTTTAAVQCESMQAVRTSKSQLVEKETVEEQQAQSQPQSKPEYQMQVLPPQTIIQKKVIIDPLDIVEAEDFTPDLADIKIELREEDEAEVQPSPAEIQKLDSSQMENKNSKPEQPLHSPRHWWEQWWDIMSYCNQHDSKDPKPPTNQQADKPLHMLKTQMDLVATNEASIGELEVRRQRKINFLEKALYEYIQRAQFHHKMPLNEELQIKIACELKDMLKIDNFVPTKSWIKHFKLHYNYSTSQHTPTFTRTPLFSLDLNDILSYCSRMDQKNANAIPTTTAAKQRESTKAIPAPTSQLVEKETVEEQQAQSQSKPQYQVQLLPPLTILQQKIILNPVVQPAPMLTKESKHILEAKDITPDIADIKIELREEDEEKVQPSPAKIQKLDSSAMENKNSKPEQPLHSPGHWVEQSSDDEELPKYAKSYEDALKLLKSVEDFAMLAENYSAIALISKLESIYKNPHSKSNDN